MQIKTQVSQQIGQTPQTVFDFLTTLQSFPSVFRGYGPIPGMLREEMVDKSAKFSEGAVRRVYSEDKSVLLEKFIKIAAPHAFIYDIVGGLKAPLAWLVKSGRSEWYCEPFSNGTKLTWIYNFQLSTPLVWPLANLVLQIFMRKAMQACLARINQKFTANVEISPN